MSDDGLGIVDGFWPAFGRAVILPRPAYRGQNAAQDVHDAQIQEFLDVFFNDVIWQDNLPSIG